ncbi:amidohydrolase family protein [Rhodobacteraceae bacterium 2CG4]|uniref:Adenine deaminase n=1 Tax=Halovulum marinum TaxID=2662447 RepID=A0A6L5Z1X4_9RHOB|nr:adenine deaminase C-terminal domain-containing protein [Halovulum marinum]MSU90052.1 amidohydrolase family protein [Halovulum marinum]
MPEADLSGPELRRRAVQAALGEMPFDLLIRGGQVVDTALGEVRPADVGLVGPLIASVHAPGLRNDAAEVIEADGGYVAPGLIDSHMHVESSMVTPAEYAAAVLPRGVTTVLWDPHELANTHGADGVDWAARAAAALPLRMRVLCPSSVPSAPGYETAGGDLDAATVAELLARPDLHGIGELMSMQALLDGSDRFTGIVGAGLRAGKPVYGHARGLSGTALQAYAAAGVHSDHELTSADDLLAKLRAGLRVELRGSHDHLLPEFVAALNDLGFVPDSLSLCTDDVFPDDLLHGGGLDDVVRRLVGYGLDPVRALVAATGNAAAHAGRPDLGAVAAGRRADLVLFRDLCAFEARLVLVDGRIVARAGRLTGRPAAAPAKLAAMPALPHYTAKDFRLDPGCDRGRVRLALIDRPRFTDWASVEAEVTGGGIDLPDGLTGMAVINRYGGDPAPRLGLLRNWGRWEGVFGTTVSHDSHNLTLFGTGEHNMAVAANALADCGGGLVVVKDGAVRECLPLPLAGLIADRPLAEVAAAFARIRAAMDEIVAWQPPYLVFKACFGASLICNAGPHLSDRGIVDTHRGIRLPSPVLEPDAPLPWAAP